MADETRLLARLTAVLAETEPRAPLADRLAVAFTRILGLGGGAITIGYSTPDRTTLCATDPRAERLEELQDLLREGPGLDAFRTGHGLVCDREQVDARWPMLAQHLDERHAVGGLVAVPMRPDDEVLGVISMYQVEGGRLEVDLDNAQFLANAIGVAILGRFARSESTEMVWSSRDRVNQATGMVVAQLRITTADALALLRAHAFAHGVPLAEVAASVVNRDLDFRKTDDGEEGQG